ncbi:MAG: hypothetical protein A2W91_10270 [Bacteroidetes bacterium GWF2_38_335]|nr:MAG: hypothetical protein A2W91_10270 [Bacteroidetes bacterium GWF2_38_335]OFY81907.1 MAG: hypothetical protein A2281_06770 [Bacteroidetes bacterium RIFOXYA12_FULL_38_20]
MAILSIQSIGQSPYILTTTQEPYTTLENPISINGTTEWNQESSFPVSAGFDFPIYQSTANSVNILSGSGFNIPYSGYYHMLFFHWPFGGSLLLDRGHGTGTSLSPLDYEIIGEAGNRILKLQWTNAGFYWDIVDNEYSTVTNSDYINFQAWFYESDGKIELRFGPSSVLNPDSYCAFASKTGPYPKFMIGDHLIDIFGDANNPSYQWISNEGIVYGNMIVGIPDNETVYIFTPDFSPFTLNETDFQTFSFPQETGPATINLTNHIINIEVESGTSLNALTSTFTLSEGATADISGITQVSGATVNDFNYPIVYTVTAEDGVTEQHWVIIATVESTGIDEQNDGLFTIYPNPSSGIIQLNGNAKAVTISNIFGKVVYNKKSDSSITTIDLQNQPDGIYFLKVDGKSYKITLARE